jgi:hypothetical protein
MVKMKSAILLMIAALVGAATMNAAVDPGLVALLPPNSSLLFGVHVQSVLASPFGKFMLTQLPANDGMMQLAAATGFDYRNDLTEIVGATVLPDGTKANLYLARGTFQVTRFMALATATGSTITGYKSAQIVSLPTEERTTVAFLDSSTVAIGSLAAVQSAEDRYLAHAQIAGPLVTKALGAGAAGDAWFATVTGADQFMKSSALPMPGMLKPVLETSMSVQFHGTGATVAGQFTAGSAQQAQALLAVMRFLTTMGASGSKGDPNAPSAVGVLGSAQFTASGTSVDMTLPIPEQTLEQLYSARPKPVNKASLR